MENQKDLIGILEHSDIEEQIQEFKTNELSEVKLIRLLKPASISLVALFLTFFLDISSVPFLGDITKDIVANFFPNWTPTNDAIQPLTFWWMPLLTYCLFIWMAMKAYGKLKVEVSDSTSRENIDRILGASISVIDGLSTALPLIGAAILLISIELGPEIFLGFSVPFEIKALIILALGKLFEPVLDVMGVRFQNIVNKSSDLKDTFYHKMQIEQSKKLLEYFESNSNGIDGEKSKVNADEMKKYNDTLNETKEISKQIYKYIGASYQILEKMKEFTSPNAELMKEFKELSESINSMTANLGDDKVNSALNSLDSIVNRKQ